MLVCVEREADPDVNFVRILSTFFGGLEPISLPKHPFRCSRCSLDLIYTASGEMHRSRPTAMLVWEWRA